MDLCFANDSNHKLVQRLYPVCQFQVNVDTLNVKNVQTFSFYFEMLNNIIQIRIVDVSNQSNMFLTTVGKCNKSLAKISVIFD